MRSDVPVRRASSQDPAGPLGQRFEQAKPVANKDQGGRHGSPKIVEHLPHEGVELGLVESMLFELADMTILQTDVSGTGRCSRTVTVLDQGLVTLG